MNPSRKNRVFRGVLRRSFRCHRQSFEALRRVDEGPEDLEHHPEQVAVWALSAAPEPGNRDMQVVCTSLDDRMMPSSFPLQLLLLLLH
jgi:pterin-4a-carbinolamine dehydratase